MNHHEQAKLGREAQSAKPVIEAAFDVAISNARRELMTADAPEAVLKAHAALKGLERAKQAVDQIIGAGQLAEQAIEAANRS